MKAELERDRATIRSQVVAEAMEQVRKDIETENSILSQLRDEKSALDKEYVSTRALLEKTQRELESAKNDLSRQLESIENSVADRIAELVDDASDLLSESVILRAVGVGSSATSTQPKQIYTAIDPFSGRSSLTPREKTSVSKLLRAAGEAFGIDATVLNRIHAAVRAGLLPVLTGNGGPAALSAYATAVCSGRITSMPVGHDFLHPVDLLGLRAANPPGYAGAQRTPAWRRRWGGTRRRPWPPRPRLVQSGPYRVVPSAVASNTRSRHHGPRGCPRNGRCGARRPPTRTCCSRQQLQSGRRQRP